MNYNISDVIEAFLLQSLGDDDSLNIRRNDLASYFSCSPSQINYVLATRFTPQRGYVIESRRGGGGFVTVVRLHGDAGDLVEEILSTPSSEGFSAGKANELIDRLCRDGLLTERESALVKAAVHDQGAGRAAVGQERTARRHTEKRGRRTGPAGRSRQKGKS